MRVAIPETIWFVNNKKDYIQPIANIDFKKKRAIRI